jgi:hypothetical protein
MDELASQPVSALGRHRHEAEQLVGLLGDLQVAVTDAGLGDLPRLLGTLLDRLVVDEERLEVVTTRLVGLP